MFWFYLFYIAASELLILTTSVLAGVVAYALMLVSLTIHATLAHNSDRRLLARGLLLIPLARILSLSVPFGMLPLPVWSTGVVLALLVPVYILARQARLNRDWLGIHFDGLFLQIMLACAGLGIGAIEYAMFPRSLVINSSSTIILTVLLSLLVLVGVIEEFMFRGLLQRLALAALGPVALVYMSLLFAVLYIGYGSPAQVIFAFGVALFFSSIARWSKSVVGVALAHGLSNVTLYLLMPFSAANPASVAARLTPWAVGIGTTLAMGAFGLLMWPGLRKGVPVYQDQPVAVASAPVEFDDPSTSGPLTSVDAYNRKIGERRKTRSRRGRRPRKKVDRRVMESGKAAALVDAWVFYRERNVS